MSPVAVPAGDLLLTVNLLAAMIWTGGMVAVTVATVAARAELPPLDQVRFFRALGRRYGVVSGAALLVFAGTGAVRAGDPSDWTDREYVVAALTTLVALLTIAGVRNARTVQMIRSQTLVDPSDAALAVRLGKAVRAATVLRVLIAVVTLAALLVATL